MPFTINREFSAGGVVYKKRQITSDKYQIKWLITKSTPSKKFPKSVWRLPKGWIDDSKKGNKPGPIASGKKRASEKQLQEATLREVEEEAGIEAKIIKKIGTETYFRTEAKRKIMKFVTFYLMVWVYDLCKGPGFETEKVEWLPFNKARKKLLYSGEKKILTKAQTILNSYKS